MEIFTPPQNAIINKLSVDFGWNSLSPAVMVAQNDKNLSIIEVSLFNKGERFIFDGADTDAYIHFTVNSALGYDLYSSGKSSDGSKLYFVITEELTTICGAHPCRLIFENDIGLVSSRLFDIIVEKSLSGFTPIIPEPIDARFFTEIKFTGDETSIVVNHTLGKMPSVVIAMLSNNKVAVYNDGGDVVYPAPGNIGAAYIIAYFNNGTNISGATRYAYTTNNSGSISTSTADGSGRASVTESTITIRRNLGSSTDVRAWPNDFPIRIIAM